MCRDPQCVFKLVMPADVIGMRMRRDRRNFVPEEITACITQTDDAHTCIDHKIPIPPAHMPDIATHEGNNMRLPHDCDAVANAAALEPSVRNGKKGHLGLLLCV